MNLDFVYNDLVINRKVLDKDVAFTVTQDIIVPDSKPDVLEVLHKSSNICINRGEFDTNRLNIRGVLDIELVYMADNETNDVRGLNTEIDINQILDIEQNVDEPYINVFARIDSIDCKVVNERKVTVIANVVCNASMECNEKISYIENVRNINEDVQSLSYKHNVAKILGHEKQSISISEEIGIDSNDILEILESKINIVNHEYKISYNKVLVKADAIIKVIYVLQDNNIMNQEIVLPFTGFIDVANISEKNIIDVMYCIKNKSVKLLEDREDKKIGINMEIGVDLKCFENNEISMIKDMYSLSRCLVFDTKCIKHDVITNLEYVTHKICESLELENEGVNIVSIDTKVLKNNIECVNGKLHFEGDICVELMCKDSNKFFVKTYTIPYTYIYENSNIKNSNSNIIDAYIKNVEFNVLNSKVDVNIEICFKIILNNRVNLSIVKDIKEDELKDCTPYSITIYYVKPGDSLWKIAKKFRTTVDEIAKYNEISNVDEYVLDVGMQLFIPQKIVKSVV